jgi:hypothetical protein
MKNVLIIYFSQTGQGKKAIDAVLKPILQSQDYRIEYALIKPKQTYPYPWSYSQFFDAFPETVNGVPCELEPTNLNTDISYDLIIIGYQPWFLNICIPIHSYLQSEQAKKIFHNKPVITIINCRNMWLGAQESMKKNLLQLNAKLVGNIVFADHSSNLVSLVTVLAFVLKGVKENFLGIFPKYGINDEDIERGEKYGNSIKQCLDANNYSDLQKNLNNQGAVIVKGNLLLMEGRGRALFPLYAKFISSKGRSGSKERLFRVKIFGIVLPTAILILSPIITILSRLIPILARKKFSKAISYYCQNDLKEG